MATEIIRYQLRRGLAAQWADANPVLGPGEPGIETDTKRQKLGDGTSTWLQLPYSNVSTAEVQQVIDATTAAGTSAFNAGQSAAAALGHKNAAEAARDAAQAVPTTTDGLVKGLLDNPGSQTAGALTATIGTKLKADVPAMAINLSARGRGALSLHFDDGTADHYTVAAPIVEAAGGRATFALWTQPLSNPAGNVPYLSHARIAELAARGHEIAAHSITHTPMTSLNATTRKPEWDTPKTFLEGITGKPVTTWAYPNSASDATTDKEAYLRYDRVFSGVDTLYSTRVERRGKTLKTGRWAWVNANQAETLRQITRASARDEVITVMTHQVDGSYLPQGVTQAQLQEVVDLAVALGMPIVTAADAFPAYRPISNGGFEDTDWAAEWLPDGVNATNGIQANPVTPAAGVGGTKSLEIVGDGTKTIFAWSRYHTPFLDQGEHTFSVRMSHNLTSGAPGSYFAVRQYDAAGTQILNTNSTIVGTLGAVAWQTLSIVLTPQPNAYSYKIVLAQANAVGQTWFDNVHAGPTRFGVLN